LAYPSFPGSAWERTAPRLRLVAPPAIHKQTSPTTNSQLSLHSFAEAEPPVRVFPGGAWEQAVLWLPARHVDVGETAPIHGGQPTQKVVVTLQNAKAKLNAMNGGLRAR
jgi:hypothetical protein